MDDRVRQLYTGEPICHEEVHQIKSTYKYVTYIFKINIYFVLTIKYHVFLLNLLCSDQLDKCLSEMMNPRVDFGKKTRSERVQCVK